MTTGMRRLLAAIGRELDAIGAMTAYAHTGVRYELPARDRPTPRTPPRHHEQVRPDLPASPIEQLLWRQLSDLAEPPSSPGPAVGGAPR
ncbi:DUF6059 family protein [Parafrankia sp. FMc2]|uniref:DUF6059 family protein n=1 Tax=Parafrankia sp. FMc2 TaxID=3233196 RepID=UPI0034D783DC